MAKLKLHADHGDLTGEGKEEGEGEEQGGCHGEEKGCAMGLHQEVKFGPAVCLHAPVSAAAHARKEGEAREKGKKKRKGKRRLGKFFKPENFWGEK
jgi:hypothetical protein